MNLRPELPGSLIDSNISLDDMRKALELGRIGQLGFLVADVPDACRHFRERYGIRTWYVPEIHGAKFFHHDEPIEQVFSIAIAYFGGYQIEGPGIRLFDEIHGDHFAILGLPLLPLVAALRERGVA